MQAATGNFILSGNGFNSFYIEAHLAQTNMKKTIIGVQGGEGSFNHQACMDYCSRAGVISGKYEIKYLYTTQGVLKALGKGKIHFGQFAIQNPTGGIVEESIEAMGWYNFAYLGKFSFPVNHCLMIAPGMTLDKVNRIISHPQAFAQCKETLTRKYSDKECIKGEGKLVDQATAALHLSQGKLPKDIAVLASKACASLYGLMLVDEGLQDDPENATTFLFVGPRKN